MTLIVVQGVVLAALHPSPPVRLGVLVGDWQHGPIAITGIVLEILAAALYLRGVHRLAARGRVWPWSRTVLFLAGIAVVAIALQSGVGHYDDSVFVVHVVQHWLLMSVAPILMVLGAPVTLAIQAGNRGFQRRVISVLHSKPARLLSHPAVVGFLNYGTMYSYFMTSLYALSVVHPLYHDFTHLQFFAVGYLFWWQVVGLDSSPRRASFGVRAGFLVLGVPFDTFLGIALMSSRYPIAPQHTVADTRNGGAVLWILFGLTMMAGLGVVVYQWMKQEERRAIREDSRLDAARQLAQGGLNLSAPNGTEAASGTMTKPEG